MDEQQKPKPTIRQLERMLREQRFSRNEAKGIIAKGVKKINREKEDRKKAQ